MTDDDAASETVTLDLPKEFAAADNAVVLVRSEPQHTIDDIDAVQLFVAALAPLAEGWGVPPDGVPVTRLRVDLKQGDRTIGNVGVGVQWLTAHVHGGFLARPSSPSVARALLDVFDLASLVPHDGTKLVAPPVDR